MINDKKKALHITNDDKFIDTTINIFSDTIYFEHQFLCFNPENNIKYIKQLDKILIIETEQQLINIINASADIVFLHGLCVNPRHLLKINTQIKIVWITWGYDIYSNNILFSKKKLLNLKKLKPHTQRYIFLYEKINFIDFLKDIIRPLLKNDYYYMFANRVDYISTALTFEFDLIMKHNNLSAKYFYYRYLYKEEPYTINGNNILLGNSAAEGNNHIDVLQYLKKMNLKDREIIIPLSYSGSESYRNYLKKYCRSLHNITIKLLLNFMPLKDYQVLIGTCQYVIFGHIRQQALYNLFQLIYNGSKIFLYKDSVVYQGLTEKKYIVFTIDDDLNYTALNTPLTEDEKLYNKNLYLLENSYNIYINKLNNELKKVYDNITVGNICYDNHLNSVLTPSLLGISYWEARAKKHGVRAVFNLSNSESEMAEITAMQVREIFPQLQSQLNGTEQCILDFGCGPGRFTALLAKLIHGKAIGVDPIQTLLDLAPHDHDVVYWKITNGIIPLDNYSVDIVWCCLVLGGINDNDIEKTVREICRVLRPSGLLFLIENTAEKPNGSTWFFRSIKEYQDMFLSFNLQHLHDYYDAGERISILSGRYLMQKDI